MLDDRLEEILFKICEDSFVYSNKGVYQFINQSDLFQNEACIMDFFGGEKAFKEDISDILYMIFATETKDNINLMTTEQLASLFKKHISNKNGLRRVYYKGLIPMISYDGRVLDFKDQMEILVPRMISALYKAMISMQVFRLEVWPRKLPLVLKMLFTTQS